MRYQISGKQIDIGEALQPSYVENGNWAKLSRKMLKRRDDANVISFKILVPQSCTAKRTVHLSTGLTASAKRHIAT